MLAVVQERRGGRKEGKGGEGKKREEKEEGEKDQEKVLEDLG